MPRRRNDDDDDDDDDDDRPRRKPGGNAATVVVLVAAGGVGILLAAAVAAYFLVFAPFMAAPPPAPRPAAPVAAAAPPPAPPKPAKVNEFVFLASVKKAALGRVRVEYSVDDREEVAGGKFYMMVKHRDGTESLSFGVAVGGTHTVEVYRTPAGTFFGEVTVWVEREKNGVRERVSPKASAF